MNDSKTILSRIKDDLRDKSVNAFDLTLYMDGDWATDTLYTAAPCQNCYSVAKSFTSTAVGIALDEGLLSLDDRLPTYFREEWPDAADPRMERVALRHLLTNTTGLAEGFLFEADRYAHDSDDWLDLCLSRAMAHDPGTYYTYSNSNFYLLSRVLAKATGQPIDTFLRHRLFDSLGIRDCAWAVCPFGYPQGGTGLYLPTEDIAKLGVLYMNEGIWDGRCLLSAAWCREAVRSQTGLDKPAYGYGIWTSPDGFAFSGAHDQVMIARPADRVVFAAHSFAEGTDYAALLDRVLAG